MSAKTSIEWTDATWNPTRGCSRVSEGCRNCYAERFASRFITTSRAGKHGENLSGRYAGFVERTPAGPRWTGKLEVVEALLNLPLRLKEPRRIFVNSMSDLFHEALPDYEIDRVFAVMALAPQHTFQVLTKRPERMYRYLTRHPDRDLPDVLHNGMSQERIGRWGFAASAILGSGARGLERKPERFPLRNVWLGVSVEDQETANERIPTLLETPAARRFVSYEPALGPVDFTDLPVPHPDGMLVLRGNAGLRGRLNALLGFCHNGVDAKIDWLIVGGESGPGARPFDIDWARLAIAQCVGTGTSCFVKQLGATPIDRPERWTEWRAAGATPIARDQTRIRVVVDDRSGGAMHEWPEELRVRTFPKET